MYFGAVKLATLLGLPASSLRMMSVLLSVVVLPGFASRLFRTMSVDFSWPLFFTPLVLAVSFCLLFLVAFCDFGALDIVWASFA